VARDLGLRHTVKTINGIEAQEALYRFVDIWDEPFGDTSGIPTSMLCRLARQQVKVALSADGGDELFCGYESYSAYDARFRRLRYAPMFLRKLLAASLRHVPYHALISKVISRNGKTRRNPQTIARFEKTLELLTVANQSDLIRVMNEKGWTAASVGELIDLPSGDILSGGPFATDKGGDRRSLVDHMMRTDLAGFLGEDVLTKVDRASMAASLECRDPMLDHRLVEFAFSLPMEYLYEHGIHKRLLKKAIQPWISPSVLSSPKRGFSIPLYDWMRGVWKPIVHEYLSPARVRNAGILNEEVVVREVDRFYRYEGGRAEKIMLMLNFQMWFERWHQK
jgi:asparagine synthase (glutamine-hydrolysing)